MLILGYQNVSAQCPTFGNCNVITVCKNISLGNGFETGGECPIKICLERQVICESLPCQVYAPACNTIVTNGGTQSVCYPDIIPSIGCNCIIKTTRITITREHIGTSGIYTSTILTGSDAQDFQDVLNGLPTSSNFFGTLDNCDGTKKINYAFSFNNGVLSAIVIP